MRLSEAHGTKVLSRGEAEQLGKVRHLLIDVGRRQVQAIHIDGRKRKALLVDWSALSGFGPDAVVVGAQDALRGPADERELAMVSGDLDWTGRRVLTDRGDIVGAVRDVEFDETTGALRTVLIDGEDYAAERVVALGPYALIVRGPT